MDLLELLDETEERSTLEERRAREADEQHNRAELRDFPKTLGEIEQLLDEALVHGRIGAHGVRLGVHQGSRPWFPQELLWPTN